MDTKVSSDVCWILDGSERITSAESASRKLNYNQSFYQDFSYCTRQYPQKRMGMSRKFYFRNPITIEIRKDHTP
ncbi:hypothetical protein EYC80_009447 [Monilinia laxa]|uniref:Uncharacterized protein n=1 Tax=Monilinia laxa TaxID=61186 RepID=A0A5N6JY98_MONLA|nr:hypothetical protein EYC80_009447 [Monilinia laxa]